MEDGRHPGESGFLDRDTELAELAALAGQARSSQGGVVHIDGPAGIGKTALLSRWIEQEQGQGVTIAAAAGRELHSKYAFSVVRQLFAPLLAACSEADRRALLSGPAELAAQALHADRGEPESSAGLSLGPVYGLYWLTVNLAERQPLIFVIDDAQWMDLPSLRWLRYLAQRLDGLPVALVLGVRGNEAYDTSALLAEIAALPVSRRLHPRALSQAGVAEMVRLRLGPDADPEFCAACAEASEGNPLLLTELLLTLADNDVVPDAAHAGTVAEFRGRVLARTVAERLGRMPSAGVRFARALAVLEDDPPAHLVASMTDLTDAEAAGLARRLRNLGILQPGTLLRYSHSAIRDAVAETMSTQELAGLHLLAAELYHHEGAAGETVVSHLMLAGPTGQAWAVEAYRIAAATARSRGALDVAATYLRQALRGATVPADRVALLLELGACELLTEPEAAAHHLGQAIVTLDDPLARGRAAALRATALLLLRRGVEAVELLQLAIAGLPPGEPALELRRLLEAQLIQTAYEEMETVPVVAERIAVVEHTAPTGDTPGERALLAAMTIHAMAGNASAARTAELADRAFLAGPQSGTATAILFALASLSFVLCDRLTEADSWYAATAEAAIRSSSPRLHFAATYGRASVAARRGDLAAAIVGARGLLDLAGAELGYTALPIAGMLVGALVDVGEPDRAEAVLTTYLHQDEPAAAWDRGVFLLNRGRLRLAQGQPAAALTALLECGHHQNAAGLTNPAITPWRSQAAFAHIALGNQPQAVTLAEQELELAHRWGTPRVIGAALRSLGVALGDADGLARLAEAAAVLESSPARLELARALTDLGAAQARRGDVTEGQESLRRGLAVADECGAESLADNITAILKITGARPRKPNTANHPVLTPSELQVASRAALGQSNREIAQALFVTPRTVEIHLTSTYRKLGISGRRQLADRLATALPNLDTPSTFHRD
jgi:DNA-binding CsgD family transcriptional regulator